MNRELLALRTCILATLAACGTSEDWPVCGNEEEVTADAYGGYGTLEPGDFLVCGELPPDGMCADKDDVNPYTFFRENVGETSSEEGDHGYSLETDCGPETTRTDACCYVIEYNGSWVSGRPLLVEGAPSLAPVRADRGEPTAGTRGEAWANMARAEHASIAAFAYFTLELLALGAPAELVSGATRAQADEVEHARLTFALAAAAGFPVAPGPLDVRRVVGPPDPVAIAVALVSEGCVAETASAAVAAMSIDGARPEERSVLVRITADERRHAQLAWSAVAWMLANFPETREPMARAFADATVELERTDIGVQVARGVVSPCAEVLLG